VQYAKAVDSGISSLDVMSKWPRERHSANSKYAFRVSFEPDSNVTWERDVQ
jgi:hypothetical protein